MNATGARGKLFDTIRVLLGLQYVLNGLNWWFKILPFPSLWDDPEKLVHKHRIVGELIATGWMFDMTKAVELATGVALLSNRFGPLMLVVSMPVLVTSFVPDALMMNVPHWFDGTMSGPVILSRIADMIFFGGALLVCQAYVMLKWLPHYRGMLVARPASLPFAPSGVGHDPLPAPAMNLIAALAIVLGGAATLWLIGMTKQWLIPWSSLRLLALR